MASILSFYQFLTTMAYFDCEDILIAPTSGWQDINSESCAGMGKNDTVIDLLRHLPYIRDDQAIYYECRPLDYVGHARRGHLRENMDEWLIDPCSLGLPDHVFYLTSGPNVAYFLLIDVNDGMKFLPSSIRIIC